MVPDMAAWGEESGHIEVTERDEAGRDRRTCGAAIALVHRWTQPGAATAAHLRLLRPSLALVEQAMAAETEAARGPEAERIALAGISDFLGRRS